VFYFEEQGAIFGIKSCLIGFYFDIFYYEKLKKASNLVALSEPQFYPEISLKMVVA